MNISSLEKTLTCTLPVTDNTLVNVVVFFFFLYFWLKTLTIRCPQFFFVCEGGASLDCPYVKWG